MVFVFSLRKKRNGGRKWRRDVLKGQRRHFVVAVVVVDDDF